MVSRAEPSLSGRWWWSIDRLILAALIALMVSGVVLLMAGGPPVAERLGLSTFHFVNRQAAYLAVAVVIFLGVSFMSPRQVRRTALLIYVVSLAMVFGTLYFGVEVKGAKRWLTLGPLGSVQPSEFVKPAFVVLAAWAFAEGTRRPDLPGTILALLILPFTIVPLVLQPDFGQTMLISLVWAGLFFVAGLHWFWVIGLGASAPPASSSPMSWCRMSAPASSASWTRARATPSRSTRRWRASRRAAGSGRGRARGR